MKADVILWQPALPNLLNLRGYEDMARTYLHGLKLLGFDGELRVNSFDPKSDVNFVFGAHLMGQENLDRIPGRCYYVNLEQVYQQQVPEEQLSPAIRYILRHWSVIDYSRFNMEFWRRFEGARTHCLPVAYGDNLLLPRRDVQEDIDVLYYGSLGAHLRLSDDYKMRFLAACADSPILRPKICFLQNEYDGLRDELIARSKIVVSVTSALIFPGVRCQLLLANGKAIVSSRRDIDLVDDFFAQNLLFADVDTVPGVLKALLDNDEDRRRYARTASESFKKIRIEDQLRDLLRADGILG